MQPETQNEPFVPVDEVARYFAVSVSTIRTWVKQGVITRDTYIKVGNTYRFRLQAVADELANATPEESNSEPDDDFVPDENEKTGGISLEDTLDELDELDDL